MQTPEFKAIVFPFHPSLLFLLVRVNSVWRSDQTNKLTIYQKNKIF